MQQIVKDKGTIVKSANRMIPQQTILNRYLRCERKPDLLGEDERQNDFVV